MEKYYYVDSMGKQAGPISKEQFSAYGITGDTLVWCKGMSNWDKVKNIPSLHNSSNGWANIPPIPNNGYSVVGVSSSNNPSNVRPDSYLAWSILSTILCCWPLGIPAIVASTKVDKLWQQGDFDGARKKSEDAKKWCLISLVGGVIIYIITFFVTLLEL